jgi:RHS repeat-associated protein
VRDYPGPTVAATDDLFYAFSFDPQGNVIQRQNSGNTVGFTYDTASYEGYGHRGADYDTGGITPAPAQDPAGFGGEFGYYTDRETGLLCLTHRYYDPGTGRFVTRDPMGYGGGVNLYGFAGDNPVNESDPSGDEAQRTWVWEEVEHASQEVGKVFVRVQRPLWWRLAVNPITFSASLFFMSQTRVADDSTGPNSPYMRDELRKEAERAVKRANVAVTRNGGKSLGQDGYFRFPNRRAALQAASEIAGDLGSNPVVLRVRDYRGIPQNLSTSNTIMGKQSSRNFPTGGSAAGWRDDFLGHSRFGAGPHVNAWAGGQMYHLNY